MFSHVSIDLISDLAVDGSSSRPSENRMKSDIIDLVQILEIVEPCGARTLFIISYQ